MSDDPLIGTELGDYRPTRVLGRGGMGVVYEADDLALRRRVALKVLRPDLVEDRVARTRFQQEIDHAVAIEHPHVVPVYSAGFERPHFYIAMRYVPGPDLSTVLAREGPLGEQRALRLLGQVASALTAVHERGLVHRDVKPHNVLVWSPGAEDEHAMLTDFGIAKALDASRGVTGMGAVGTPGYMAPEVLRGSPATPAADQYAFGCMAFEMLAGQLPYPASEVGHADAHLHQTPRSLTTVAPHVTSAVARAVDRALAEDPGRRHATVRDFVRAARAATEAFDRSQAITQVLAQSTGSDEAISRLLSEPAPLADMTIALVTDVDPATVARARRRTARSALVGRPADIGTRRLAARPRTIAARDGDGSRTPARALFGAALKRDPTGESWLARLLASAPQRALIPDAVRRDPGNLSPDIEASLGSDDRVAGGVAPRAVFERRIDPPARFLRWCIEHPDQLTWPRGQRFTADTQRWRRALLFDEPPGRRAAQAEARAEFGRLGTRGAGGRWWEFEDSAAPDCILVTGRIVLVIECASTEWLAPPNSWYPRRSALVRDLEAVHELAAGRHGLHLRITRTLDAGGASEAVQASVEDGTPHLRAGERRVLSDSYLGHLAWDHAAAVLSGEPDTPLP